MTLIITFDLEHDLGSSILFQKWILDVRIIWKSGITLLSWHISSKVAFFSVFDMLISYYAHKKSSPRLPSWQPSLISFNTPIESGSIIKPCTLKHFQVPILAPGLLVILEYSSFSTRTVGDNFAKVEWIYWKSKFEKYFCRIIPYHDMILIRTFMYLAIFKAIDICILFYLQWWNGKILQTLIKQ